MKVKAKRLFCSPIFGNVAEGDVITVNEKQYQNYLSMNLIDEVKAEVKPKAAQVKKAK